MSELFLLTTTPVVWDSSCLQLLHLVQLQIAAFFAPWAVHRISHSNLPYRIGDRMQLVKQEHRPDAAWRRSPQVYASSWPCSDPP